jgi:hypothetical protein
MTDAITHTFGLVAIVCLILLVAYLFAAKGA